MELSWTSWIILTVTGIIGYMYYTRSPWKRLPPGPPAFPFIGSIPFLIGDPRNVFKKMAEKYGNVIMLYMGSERVLVLNGYDTIKEALVKTPRAFDGRSQAMFKGFIDNMGVILSQGAMWKEQRRFVLHTLKQFSQGQGPSKMEEIIREEAAYLVHVIRNIDGAPFDPQPLFQKAIGNGIAGFIFGKRFDHDDPFFVKFMEATTEVMEISGPTNPGLFLKPLRHIPGDPFRYFEMKEISKRIELGWYPIINEHRERLEHGEEPTDLISIYLQEMKIRANEPDSSFSDYQLAHVIGDMFVAGTDTTSNTITWVLLYLILHPDIQRKIQAEIDDVIGSGRPPCLHDRNNMHYLEATISETQRLCDVVPMSVPRATMEDVEFQGHFIPKETMVLPNLHSIHWDPALWPEPDKFDPTRFLDDQGKYKKSDYFVPFSLGKRMCLGESLAKMQLFLQLSTVLQNYSLSVVSGHTAPSTSGVLGITFHSRPFQLVAHTR